MLHAEIVSPENFDPQVSQDGPLAKATLLKRATLVGLLLTPAIILGLSQQINRGGGQIETDAPPQFGPGYTLLEKIEGEHIEMAILDEGGTQVSDWYTISPEKNSIHVNDDGEVIIVYHTKGGKKPDAPWFWTLRENNKPVRSGSFEHQKSPEKP